jgi:hypothetical protein
VALSRTALARSAGPAMSYSSIWLGVCHSTPAQPWITSSTMACHISRVSVMKK